MHHLNSSFEKSLQAKHLKRLLICVPEAAPSNHCLTWVFSFKFSPNTSASGVRFSLGSICNYWIYEQITSSHDKSSKCMLS